MKTTWVAILLVLNAGALHAQRLEVRLGALASTALVEDLGPNSALARRIPADDQGPVRLGLAPAPIATVGVVHDLSSHASLELMGSVAVSKLRAQTRDDEWDTQDISMAALTAGVRYQYRPRLYLHAGLGLTRFFSEDTGIFVDGTGMLPLLELGVSTSIPLRALPLRAGARIQTHTFGTDALRRDGASDGRVARLLLQVGLGG
ncbi:MAG: hypothetical protein ACREMA_10005 [Longimicrobiales bacterium]